VILRRATLEDIPELLRIEDECFGKERFSVEVVRVQCGDAFTVVATTSDVSFRRSASCLVSEDVRGKRPSIAVAARENVSM
jgi:hypothetical protein